MVQHDVYVPIEAPSSILQVNTDVDLCNASMVLMMAEMIPRVEPQYDLERSSQIWSLCMDAFHQVSRWNPEAKGILEGFRDLRAELSNITSKSRHLSLLI